MKLVRSGSIKQVLLLIAATIFIVTGVQAQTTLLSVDINAGSSPSPAGFSKWTIPDSSTLVTTSFGSINLALNASAVGAGPSLDANGDLTGGVAGGVVIRGRTAIADTGGLYGSMYTDFATAVGAIDLEISGLATNTAYALTVWSYDENGARTTGYTNYTGGAVDYLGTIAATTALPTSNTNYSQTFILTTDLQGRLIIQAATVSSLCIFNGFQIATATNLPPSTILIKSDSTTMDTAADWGGTAPALGYTGQFDSSISADNEANLTLGGPVTLSGLVFLDTLIGPVGISDASTLTLSSAGIDMSVANQDVTINCPIYDSPNGATFIKVASGRTLTLGGGSSVMFNGYSVGLGTLLLSASSPKTFVCSGSGQSFEMGDPATGVGGFVIGANCTVSSSASFQAGNDGNGLITINGGTLSMGGGYVIVGRGSSLNTGRVILANGAINIASGGNVLIGFQNANGEIDVMGGSLNAPNSYAALNNGGSTASSLAALAVSGGLASFRVIDFGGGYSASTAGTARLVVNGGALYVGSGGMIETNIGIATFTNSIVLSGGMVGALANWSSSLPMVLTNDTGNVTFQTADTSNNPYNITLSGGLSGPGGLNKTGGGTLTLNGSNTYLGGTTVSEGTLATTTSSTGDGVYSVASGTTLNVQVAAVGTTLNMSSLTLEGGSTLNLDANAFGNPIAPIINISGALMPSSTVTINVSGTGLVSGQFPIIKYGSLGGAGFSAFVLASPAHSVSLVNDTTNHSIDLKVTTLTWDGTVNGDWDIGSTANWKGGQVYTESGGTGPIVIFDDTASGPNTEIALNTMVSPASVMVSNSVLSYSISGSGGIAGAGNLLKEGAGTLTLGGANTYTGGTIVDDGTFALGSTNNASMDYIINGGTLKVSLASSGTSLPMSSLSLGDGSSQLMFDLGNKNSSNMGMGFISDSGSLTMNGDVTVNVTNPPAAGNIVLLRYSTRSGSGKFVAGGTLPTGAAIVDDRTYQEVVYEADTNHPFQHIIKVYLQGGQSNSDGRALTNGLPLNLLLPQTDVSYYYNSLGLTSLQPGGTGLVGGFGPELTFGRTLADFYAQTNHVPVSEVRVAILKYAVGGTSLYSDWAAGGDATTSGDGPQYIAFQNAVKTGLSKLAMTYSNATIELDGMIWVQGESDIDPPNPAIAGAYGTNLVNFIKDVRLTYATNQPYGTNLPFFLSRISTNQTVYSNPSVSQYPDYLLVRAGQAYAAATLPNTYMIDTDGTNFTVKSDHLHFDTDGQQVLGIAFAKTFIGALPRPQITSLIQSGTNWRVTFTGASGLDFNVQRATSLLGPWINLTDIVTGAQGIATFEDQFPPAGNAFYRTIFP